MNETIIDSKVRINAKSAYLMVFASILLLLNKDNKYINNEFVRSHTKIAFLIHIGFLISYVIFIHFWFWREINILWLWLNHIFASIAFLFLFWILLFWFYLAHIWKYYKLSHFSKIYKFEKIVNISPEMKLSEKDKLTIILAYVPLLWYIVYWRYYKSKVIKNISTVNILSCLMVSIFYIFWFVSISSILFLVYIIFVVFLSINLVINNKTINFNIPFISSFEEIFAYFKAFIIYLKNYIAKKEFVGFLELKDNLVKSDIELEKKQEEEIKDKKELVLNKYLIYIPIINLIFIFQLKTKYYYHIRNGVTITFLMIILYILWEIWFINKGLVLLFIFPLFYGFWYLDKRFAYKIPIVYDISEFFSKYYTKIKALTKKTNELRKTDNKISLKVSWVQIEEKKEKINSEVLKSDNSKVWEELHWK